VITSPRWTHVALPSGDLEASIAWYERYTPLRVVQQRRDPLGSSAWLGHPEPVEHPFILVLVCFDVDAGTQQPHLLPFAHLGMELPSQAEVDDVAARARAENCLVWEPAQHPPPVGYVCAASDPDGNVIEFSFGQDVYAVVRALWGEAHA
jgi:lactoylglutathione lyase